MNSNLEENLQRIIRNSKKMLLNCNGNSHYDTLVTTCWLTPIWSHENTSFKLELFCVAMNSETSKTEKLYEETTQITLHEFKEFSVNCAKKYLGQFEVVIPSISNRYYEKKGDKPSVKELCDTIDNINKKNCWWLASGIGMAFRVIDRIM